MVTLQQGLAGLVLVIVGGLITLGLSTQLFDATLASAPVQSLMQHSEVTQDVGAVSYFQLQIAPRSDMPVTLSLFSSKYGIEYNFSFPIVKAGGVLSDYIAFGPTNWGSKLHAVCLLQFTGMYEVVLSYVAKPPTGQCATGVLPLNARRQLDELAPEDIRAFTFYPNVSPDLLALRSLDWIYYLTVVFLFLVIVVIFLWGVCGRNNRGISETRWRRLMGANVYLLVLYSACVTITAHARAVRSTPFSIIVLIVQLLHSGLILLEMVIAIRYRAASQRPTSSPAAVAPHILNGEVEPAQPAPIQPPLPAVSPKAKLVLGPEGGDQSETNIYFCPVCMMYFSAVLKTMCCDQYMCHGCATDCLDETASDGQTYNDGECIYCRHTPLQFALTRDGEAPRKYEDTPFKSKPVNFVPASPLRIGDTFETMQRKLVGFGAVGYKGEGLGLEGADVNESANMGTGRQQAWNGPLSPLREQNSTDVTQDSVGDVGY